MKASRVVSRIGLLIGIGTGIPGLATIAQTTSMHEAMTPAPALRKLTGDDAKRAAELGTALETALESRRWHEAISRTDEIVSLRARIQGKDHFETANAVWQVKTVRRLAELSPDDLAAFISSNELSTQADSLFEEGKYAAAQGCHEKALEIRRRVLGEDFSQTATSYNNLANTHFAQGKYAVAQAQLEKSLAIHQRVLSDNHPDTASSLDNLATIYKSQAKFAAAQPMYEKAL